MEIREVTLSDPLVTPLLTDLAAEYAARYGAAEEIALATPGDFHPPAGQFVALVDADTIVAGGGFRPLADGVCEIKRMWTATGHRRRGHARTVLDTLESAARSVGYTTVRLETGPAQPEAEALYLARGYRRIATYGPYAQALAFELTLDGHGAS